MDEEDYDVKMIDDLFKPKAKKKKDLDRNTSSGGRLTTGAGTDSDGYTDDELTDVIF